MNTLERNIVLSICYLGFAPIVALLPRYKKNDFLSLHIHQSIILWSWFFLLCLITGGLILFLTGLVLYAPNFYQNWDIELWFMSVVRKLFLCWLVFLLFGFGSAILKSTQLLPFVSCWIRKKCLLRFSEIVNVCIILLIISISAINGYVYFLLYPRGESPKVYVLYDNLDYLPQWIFNIGFFPIIQTGCNVYGRGGVALRVIDKDSFAEALKNAEIIFVASHGMEEGMLSRKGLIKPEDIQRMEVNDHLKFVYLSACKSGAQKEVWEKAFKHARVLTYQRMTATFEHAWWFWVNGPKIIKGEYKEE